MCMSEIINKDIIINVFYHCTKNRDKIQKEIRIFSFSVHTITIDFIKQNNNYT